jgi:hypothetical protein
MGEFDLLRGSIARSLDLGTSPVDGGSSYVLERAPGGGGGRGGAGDGRSSPALNRITGGGGDGRSSSALNKTTGGGSADDGRSSSALNRTTGGGSAGGGRSSSAPNRTTGGGRGGGPGFSDYETVTQMNKAVFWRSLTTKGKAISVDRNGEYNTMLFGRSFGGSLCAGAITVNKLKSTYCTMPQNRVEKEAYTLWDNSPPSHAAAALLLIVRSTEPELNRAGK